MENNRAPDQDQCSIDSIKDEGETFLKRAKRNGQVLKLVLMIKDGRKPTYNGSHGKITEVELDHLLTELSATIDRSGW